MHTCVSTYAHIDKHVQIVHFLSVLFIFSLPKIRIDIGMNFSHTHLRVLCSDIRTPEIRWKIAFSTGSDLPL